MKQNKLPKLILAALLIVFAVAPMASQAGQAEKEKVRTLTLENERSKSISFEDSVVEGLDKNPYDSLENVARLDNDRMSHLYTKRDSYRKEMRNRASQAGYSQ